MGSLNIQKELNTIGKIKMGNINNTTEIQQVKQEEEIEPM